MTAARMPRLIGRFVVIAFTATTAVAFAQETPRISATLAQVFACMEVASDADRLACYDAAIQRLHDSHARGEFVSVDQEQVAVMEREAFGFSLPSLPRLFPRERTVQDDVREVTTAVAALRIRLDGKAVITMANGQVWEQTDSTNSEQIRVGRAARIRRAALGSYVLSVEGASAALRVRRVE